MRDPKRIDMIASKLAHIWKEVPDMRLWQFLMVVVGEVFEDNPGFQDAFFIEDDLTIKTLDRLIEKEKKVND